MPVAELDPSSEICLERALGLAEVAMLDCGSAAALALLGVSSPCELSDSSEDVTDMRGCGPPPALTTGLSTILQSSLDDDVEEDESSSMLAKQ